MQGFVEIILILKMLVSFGMGIGWDFLSASCNRTDYDCHAITPATMTMLVLCYMLRLYLHLLEV